MSRKSLTALEQCSNRSSGSSVFMNGAGAVTVNGIAGGVDGMILY
ncbi:MAG: hypothetical protein U5M51_05700 [Emticicia sp.]|nr:hypothetical protein [Emticicia sp.]